MKLSILSAVFALSAVPAFADSHVTYTDPEVVGEKVTTSEHGSLPGGDKTKWSTREGSPDYSEWNNVGDPEVSGYTSTQIQERSATQTDVALNPANRTVGTDRFDQTTTWTEERKEITTSEPPAEPDKKDPPCGGNCGNGNGNGGGNGTGSEGQKKRP